MTVLTGNEFGYKYEVILKVTYLSYLAIEISLVMFLFFLSIWIQIAYIRVALPESAAANTG